MSKRTPAEARAWRAELAARCEAFLARNDAETFQYAKIDGGYYSDHNAVLIAVTAEEAGLDPAAITAVGAYGRWQAVGRQVRKGATALRVWAPAGESKPDPDDPDSKGRKFFRPVAVFAFEQTDPMEVEEAEVVEATPASIAAYA